MTAAHEFFHAVQFAYDWKEDLWLMEGTAAWIEDEVYDEDQRQPPVPRRQPARPRQFSGTPLDSYTRTRPTRSGYQYGVWIFWRYLSERVLGREIVRPHLDAAPDTTPGALDEYSTKATVNASPPRARTSTTSSPTSAAANTPPGHLLLRGRRTTRRRARHRLRSGPERAS